MPTTNVRWSVCVEVQRVADWDTVPIREREETRATNITEKNIKIK